MSHRESAAVWEARMRMKVTKMDESMIPEIKTPQRRESSPQQIYGSMKSLSKATPSLVLCSFLPLR